MEKKNRSRIIFVTTAALLLAGLVATGYATNRSAINHLQTAVSEMQMLQQAEIGPAGLQMQAPEDEAADSESPKVPDSMVFAGDTVRFDRADIYERMDRELMAFTYSHQLSLLMLKRSTKYFPIIEPILKANGVPDDLKYLMVIESNLDPEARSGSGAAGFWQFLPGTAKEYGLEVEDTYDERYDPVKETVAACKYLKKAYAKYGDWMTVAASYNAGQNGISRRLAHQKQSTAVDLWLPAETSRYIFRILTAKMMFEDPAAFGYNLEKEDYYKCIPVETEMTVSGDIEDLAEFAADHGTSFAQLHRANPWLRDIQFKPKDKTKKFIIIIPQQ